MTEFKSLNSENEKSIIHEAMKVMKEGGIILYPTETVYGIGCDARNEKAVKKIAKFKKRNNKKPYFSVGIANINDIKKYGKVIETSKTLINKLLPGPFTIILESNQVILPDMKTIGIRIPEKSFFSQLLISYKRAIVTTSANLKGKKAPICFIEIEKEVLDFVDYAIDGQCTKYGEGSTIINATQESYRILRKGAGKLERNNNQMNY
jgi:L-threonylcarbamoyladenylate synthase